jgi:hypothetical protein
MNIENGTYRARAVFGQLGETSTGKEQVAVEFELLDLEGQPRITWFGYFTEKTEQRTIEALRRCGWMGLDLTDLRGLDSNEVSIVVEAEEYNGTWTPRVKWVNAPGGMALKAPLMGAKASAFAARMKAKIAAFDQSQAFKPRPGPPTAAPAPRAQAKPNGRPAKSQGVLSPEPPPIAHDPSADDLSF